MLLSCQTTELENLRTVNRELEAENKDASAQIADLQEETERLKKETSALTAQIEALSEAAAAYKTEQEQTAGELEKLRILYSSLQADYNELVRSYSALEADYTALEEEKKVLDELKDNVYAAQKLLMERSAVYEENKYGASTAPADSTMENTSEETNPELLKYREEEKQSITEVSGIISRDDRESGYTWYFDKKFNFDTAQAFFLYIGKRSGEDPVLRLALVHRMDSFERALAAQRIIVKTKESLYNIEPEPEALSAAAGPPPTLTVDMVLNPYLFSLVTDILSGGEAAVAPDPAAGENKRLLSAVEIAAMNSIIYTFSTMGGDLQQFSGDS